MQQLLLPGSNIVKGWDVDSSLQRQTNLTLRLDPFRTAADLIQQQSTTHSSARAYQLIPPDRHALERAVTNPLKFPLKITSTLTTNQDNWTLIRWRTGGSLADCTRPAQKRPGGVFDLDAALRNSLRRASAKIETHLICLERDIQVGQTNTKLHCYFLPFDANGRIRMKPLAEFLRNQIIDYAIPRKTIQEAVDQVNETGSTAALSSLHERAKRLFTHLAKSGEGGELLLFAMAEALFNITQIICKMTLKTSTSMHYHGADGVYAEARPDGGLNLYWGESKIYGDAAAAIRNCLESLAPFLREPEGEDAARDQDILLINEFANFTDERIIAALKKFLDKNDKSSLTVRHCGFALSAFDCDCYPGDDIKAKADELAAAITEQLKAWIKTADSRICHEKLEKFDIHFVCVPLPSADAFRSYFLSLLGVKNDS